MNDIVTCPFCNSKLESSSCFYLSHMCCGITVLYVPDKNKYITYYHPSSNYVYDRFKIEGFIDLNKTIIYKRTSMPYIFTPIEEINYLIHPKKINKIFKTIITML